MTRIQDLPTILEAVLWGKKELAGTGIANPRSQSELLLGHVLKKDRLYLHLNPKEKLTPEEWKLFRNAISRRAGGEPLQYITGVQNFMGFDFRVTPDVLIPRQDTERLIEVVTKWLEQYPGKDTLKIADLGTGSGAIGITLARLNPRAHVYAVDISDKAIEMAQKNAESLGVTSQMTFLRGDLFGPLEALELKGQLDIVASNPPYIAFSEKETLATEVREHEPHLALFSPEEGMAFYRRIIPGAGPYLKKGGLLALEIGSTQAGKVRSLLETAGYSKIAVHQDYAGLDRVLTAEFEGPGRAGDIIAE